MPEPPTSSQPGGPTGAEVAQLVRAVYRHAGALTAEMAGRAQHIHPTDHNAIRLLEHAASRRLTVGQLGRELGLSSAAVTEAVDRLEALGYVQRERDAADRRRVHVVLTDASRDLAMAVLAPLMERLREAIEARSTAELAVVRDFLAEVLDEGDEDEPLP